MSDRKSLKQLTRAVSRILWTDWNPIGCRVPENEYDSYAPGIVRMLVSGVDRHRLAEHLDRLATGAMGLQGNTEHSFRIAEVLLKLANQPHSASND
jgi:hypothetical protein